jgi:hypothetical protein
MTAMDPVHDLEALDRCRRRPQRPESAHPSDHGLERCVVGLATDKRQHDLVKLHQRKEIRSESSAPDQAVGLLHKRT